MKTTREQPFIRRTSLIEHASYLLLSFMLVLGLGVMGCEGPQGPQGERGQRGEQGPEGPVGPAGEDGSMMHAGKGAPTGDIGKNGDYYLNQNTGELYGPKTDDGWGKPIIVLKGEDGQDGEDGEPGPQGPQGPEGPQGPAGEDGSQIHAGSGEPDPSLGVEGDFYLDKDHYELFGPKTGSGWGSPLNIKGADGNANVTRYLFPGHDFTSDARASLTISGIGSIAEMQESSWHVYLVWQSGEAYHHVPGVVPGGDSYGVNHGWNSSSNEVYFVIDLESGTGMAYYRVEVVRIEASNTVDHTKGAGEEAIVPDHLDISNYEEVAEYYGFGSNQ